ncbi:MAG: Terpene utilization protein AtuA [uncultured Acidimicrobiales bacterium]|uniref:Terpene utilization protein AtuA n=1 Tax=uncultured Acidimicrobiales bacterium TaxID=310071 RepID=A0A6J4IIP5_9ACTN|nr:MAG: Terpene utilization protein AtuA [uncultured Acidimicrobiales bacterium]
MAEPLRIANCSGFYGDRLDAAREMVEGGPIDVLTGDWLAELTMLILARTRAKRPGGGFARSFVQQMEHVMGSCLDRGIKVVSNAGGLDPDGCAEAVAEVAGRLGLAPVIAYVQGDDLLPRLDELKAAGIDLAHLETGEPIGDTSRFVSANAYLGCWGIVEALGRGADIVITGRTTDAAIVCGPAAWHHGWERDSWDELAGGVVAGHVIECGTQASGGNYSFFTEVPGMSRTGFPWAEVASDGSSVIGKHDATGGEVSVGTVTSQLLYEIGGPSYLGPDVTARFDTISLEQVGRDRVRISGTRGEPPPATLKVAMNELGGYRNEVGVGLTGLDIEAKAALVEEAFWRACPHAPEDYESVTSHLTRTDKVDPATNEEAVAVWRLTLKDPDERKVGRVVFNANVELALATIPGYFGIGGGGGEARPYGVFRPAVVPADLVPQHVVVGGEPTAVDSGAPAGNVEVVPVPGPAAPVPAGPTEPVPLGRVVGARSGDKGGNANLGVFARSDEAWAWLDDFLTTERFRQLLPETAPLAVDRHRLPAIRSLNFVVHGLLQEGVAASTRQDGQAKGLGEWLRARVVDVPSSLLDAAPVATSTTGGSP